MSTTATKRAPKPAAPTAIKLENQYKPVGISAVTAAALCKGTAKPTPTGK